MGQALSAYYAFLFSFAFSFYGRQNSCHLFVDTGQSADR
jgi:hypothetical protein